MRSGVIKIFNTQGDSDIISMPAGFRRHLVGNTLINVFHCDITEIRFVVNLLIMMAWHNGRMSVSGRRTFPVLRSTCS